MLLQVVALNVNPLVHISLLTHCCETFTFFPASVDRPYRKYLRGKMCSLGKAKLH